MDSPTLLRLRVRRSRMRLGRLGHRILGWLTLILVLAALHRGYGPYYLFNVSPPECAGERIVICTNHSSYRTLEHVQVVVTNRTGVSILVARDPDTGGVVLSGELQYPPAHWAAGGLGLPCPQCTQNFGMNPAVYQSPPPQFDTVRLPTGGSISGEYVLIFPQNTGQYRLVLAYDSTDAALRAAEDILNDVLTGVPNTPTLPTSTAIAMSAPFYLIDNGDRFPKPPLRSEV